MYAYVDQNFLINCANQPGLRATAVEAATLGKVSFVLSPWHFYEIGKSGPERIQELLAVVADLQPLWILERFDLQLAEFRQAWGKFWGEPYLPFVPIGRLPEIASALLRVPSERLENASLTHYVDVFGRLGSFHIDPVLDDQQAIASANQVSYREGRVTRSFTVGVERNYVARQLASLRTKFSNHEEHARQLMAVMNNGLSLEKIRCFVDWGGMRDLHAFKVESILTDVHNFGVAVLSANRQIDRQHAVAGLSYCDRFITDDKELLRRCAEVARQAPFKVAEAQTAAALFASI